MDNPDHKIYRAMTQSWFSPPNLMKLKSEIEILAKNYVDEVRNKIQSEIVLVAFDVNKSKKFLNDNVNEYKRFLKTQKVMLLAIYFEILFRAETQNLF